MFGAGQLGRLKYRTAEEARGAARDLGLSGVHSHKRDGERIWMPGKNHEKLNAALRARGLEETMMPGGGMDEGMMDGGMMDGEEMMGGDEMDELLFGDAGLDEIAGDSDGDGDMELY